MKYTLTIATDDPNDIVRLLSGTAITGATVSPPSGDDDDDTGPAAVVQPGEVDATGLPWDERIHAGTKTKNADGKWKKRKGVDDATVTAVEGELRARVAVQTAPGVVPPPAAAPVPPPTTPPAPAAAPVPPPATPPAPAPAPVPPAATGAKTFAELMQAISNGVATNKIDADGQFVAWMAGQLGVTNITEVAASPDQIAKAFQIMQEQNRL